MAVSPFKIDIPDSELDLLRQKLDLARLPTNISNDEWGEENGVTVKFMSDTIKFWREKYDWRAEEARLNEMPQFQTSIEVDDGFGTLDVHFVHSTSSSTSSSEPTIPLLFLHGWPGSFAEVQKVLPLLNKAGFDVVAPSLPGYGFSTYTTKAGFKHKQHAEIMVKLMARLRYERYVVQGGGWGSDIARVMGLMYPEKVKAIHVNMLMTSKPHFPPGREPTYTTFEKHSLSRLGWFQTTNSAYDKLQSTKPRTLGFALHDSPIAMLSWMTDKLHLWTDDDYHWNPTELITWTLLHYFPGPTPALQMYFENSNPVITADSSASDFLDTPMGVSAFPKELGVVPRCWAETVANVAFWREHDRGGHFAAYEKPDVLVEDLAEFFREVWKG